MAEKTPNLTEIKKLIADSLYNVNQAELDRKDINADIQAIREKLAAKGIPKRAFDLARSYMKMDPDDREGFDIAYALVREVGGLPLQDDLFAAAARKGSETVEAETLPKETAGPDMAAVDKVIQSQEAEKTKGKKVLPSNTGTGAIN